MTRSATERHKREQRTKASYSGVEPKITRVGIDIAGSGEGAVLPVGSEVD